MGKVFVCRKRLFFLLAHFLSNQTMIMWFMMKGDTINLVDLMCELNGRDIRRLP